MPGSKIDWKKGEGAQHLTADECLAAKLAPPPVLSLRGPQPERPEDRARLEKLMAAHPWRVAKTMPKIPHEYTLRRLWLNDEDFIWAVEYIRRVGYEHRFGGRVFIYWNFGPHMYFPCDGVTCGPL